MKKIIASILVTMMTLSLVSCGSNETNNNQTNETEIQGNTEIEVSEEEQAQEPVELSDDLWSCDFLVNGKLYHVPMWFSELEDLGWEYVTVDGTILSLIANQSTQDPNMFRNGSNSLFTTFYNMSINQKPYTECAVVEITVAKQYLDEGEWEVILPAGIQFGVSTLEDITAAYGEPKSVSQSGSSYYLNYKQDLKHEIRLELESIDGTLCSMVMRNYAELEGVDNTVSMEVPESVKNYKAADALGDSLQGTNIEINGKIYSLPCPVAEFVNEGIVLESEYSGINVPSGASEYVVFNYNGQIFSTMVQNHSPYATTTDNCFVKEIEIGTDMDSYEWAIVGGIKRGSTEDEVLKLLEGYEYEIEEIGDSYKYYKVEYFVNYEREYYSIGLTDGIVTSITVKSYVTPEY